MSVMYLHVVMGRSDIYFEQHSRMLCDAVPCNGNVTKKWQCRDPHLSTQNDKSLKLFTKLEREKRCHKQRGDN